MQESLDFELAYYNNKVLLPFNLICITQELPCMQSVVYTKPHENTEIVRNVNMTDMIAHSLPLSYLVSAIDFSQPIHLDWLGTTIIRREGCFQLWFTDQQQSVVVNTPAVICWLHLQKSPGYSIIWLQVCLQQLIADYSKAKLKTSLLSYNGCSQPI